ncbi:hypothetical protein GQX74_007943 [Glossina fuscipes]|nr:hypothetical protein GQX74_007943 [Glossina fuscipes]
MTRAKLFFLFNDCDVTGLPQVTFNANALSKVTFLQQLVQCMGITGICPGNALLNEILPFPITLHTIVNAVSSSKQDLILGNLLANGINNLINGSRMHRIHDILYMLNRSYITVSQKK